MKRPPSYIVTHGLEWSMLRRSSKAWLKSYVKPGPLSDCPYPEFTALFDLADIIELVDIFAHYAGGRRVEPNSLDAHTVLASWRR